MKAFEGHLNAQGLPLTIKVVSQMPFGRIHSVATKTIDGRLDTSTTLELGIGKIYLVACKSATGLVYISSASAMHAV